MRSRNDHRPDHALDLRMMDRALSLAARGHPSPNPHVGAVLVRGGEILAEGHHERAGEAHAEVAALAQVGFSAPGATLYVTLEPCSHQGRTGPCWIRIVEAGIERVVIGCRDPVVAHAGGAALLRARGVKTEIGVRHQAAQQLIADFTKHACQDLPYVLVWSAKSASLSHAPQPALDAAPSSGFLPLDAVLIQGTSLEHAFAQQLSPLAAPQWIVIDPDLAHAPRLQSSAPPTARLVVYCEDRLARAHEWSLSGRKIELRSIPPGSHAQYIRPLLHALAQSGIVRLGAVVTEDLERPLLDQNLVDEMRYPAQP